MNLKFTFRINFLNTGKMLKLSMLFSALFATGLGAYGQSGIWRDVDASTMSGTGKNYIVPEKFRSVAIDISALKSYLMQAPLETAGGNYSKTFYFTFPMPDGTDQQFWIVESPVMAPELAAKYPGIKTYGGQGIDDPTATVRMDVTDAGFHAMILSVNGSFFIDPYFWHETTYYISYSKADYFPSNSIPACATVPDKMPIDKSVDGIELRGINPNTPPVANKSIGTQLRTYDLALAATGEYSAFHGGTKPLALAAMVTSVNRVDGIYEREVDVRLVLIANTDTLIYTNSATDPYDNFNGANMLAQNQAIITQLIGALNYDIGHVFSTGGGGIAGLGVVCNTSQKARGVTGLPAPVGDPYDVDYVAHEMGHQFGGNHTFNCTTGSCSGNRDFSSAYEPGSGSTIMAYAGICPPNDLQPHSDAVFHTKSFDDITVYTISSTGNFCANITATGNQAPVINPGANYIVPYLTPFKLTGSAWDPDAGDTVTYMWEEYDLGSACAWNAATGNAPSFRSWSPTLSPERLFPKLSKVLNPTTTVVGEYMVNYARTFKFKLTVRDNKFGGGGVTNNDTPVTVQTINTGTPFAITSPNTTGIVYNSLALETITWDVAATDVAPINTTTVDIYLSIDGGQTFPIPLGNGVPNTGSYQWWTPLISTTTARVRVEGFGNIFFDINDKNFTITGTVGIKENDLTNSISVYPNPSNDVFSFAMENKYYGNVQVNVYDKLGRLVTSEVLNKTGKSLVAKLPLESAESGIYSVEFTFDQAKAVKRLVKL